MGAGWGLHGRSLGGPLSEKGPLEGQKVTVSSKSFCFSVKYTNLSRSRLKSQIDEGPQEIQQEYWWSSRGSKVVLWDGKEVDPLEKTKA